MIEQSFHGGDYAAIVEQMIRRAETNCKASALVLAGGVQEQMRDQGMIATGTTAQSVNGFADRHGDIIEVGIAGNQTLEWVMHGRGPGTPPPTEAIAKWVASKSATKASQINQPGRQAPMAILMGGYVAQMEYARAIQRMIAAKRARQATSVQVLSVVYKGRMSPQQVTRASREMSRRFSSAPPPLAAIEDWVVKNGIFPTKQQTLNMIARSIALGIGRRGTRRFRGEVPDPVHLGIRKAAPEALAVLTRGD